MKKVKLKNNKYLSTESIVHNQSQLSSLLDSELFLNVTTGQEVPTNEFRNGKRVYIKDIVTTELINGDGHGIITISHEIENVDMIWIDLGNSFIKEVSSGGCYPIVTALYDLDTAESLQVSVNKNSVYLFSNRGWRRKLGKEYKVKIYKSR